MSIKYILLDLDDTLYDFKSAEVAAITAVLLAYDIPPNPHHIKRYSEINRECWQMLEEGKMAREEILVERFRRFFTELGKPHIPSEVRDLYEAHLSKSAVFFDGAEELLTYLRGKYTVAVATNGTARVQKKRISEGRLRDKVDYIFISEELGYTKPAREYFDACLKAMGANNPLEVIVVGDSESSDIRGGINAGIHTCLFEKPGGVLKETAAEYRISKLSDLKSVLADIANRES